MRILCDQMVRESYLTALSAEEDHTVRRVRSVLDPETDDATISAYAAEHDWVLLTADEDFFANDPTHGLLYYDDLAAPAPGTLRDAIRQIDLAYDDPAAIIESVPGDWV